MVRGKRSANHVPARLAIAGAILLSLLITSGCSRESRYPDQPINLICPWSPGGGTDRVSRQVAAQLEEQLGVPVSVINATGGSGVTGHTRGATARPDGYTLTMITVELNLMHWRGLTNVTYQDFAPLQLINRDSAALFVRHDSPYANLNELQAAMESNPGRLKASGTAFGGIWHVALAGWIGALGLDSNAATWISINGSGPSLQELIAGGVDIVCCSLPEADAMLSGGQVRCLGVMSDSRINGFNDVPTFRELGHDWKLEGWRGLAAPRDTPPDRLVVLTQALNTIVASESMKAFMSNAGFGLSPEGPEAFASTLQQQDAMFREVLTGPAFQTMSGEHFGPMVFPILILILLLMAGVFALTGARREFTAPESAAVRETAAVARIPAMVVLIAACFYFAAAERLGFVLTAIFMLVGLLLYFRTRLSIAIPLAGVVSVLVYQVFAIALRVPLPRGLLGW